jgi:hypothetical protein
MFAVDVPFNSFLMFRVQLREHDEVSISDPGDDDDIAEFTKYFSFADLEAMSDLNHKIFSNNMDGGYKGEYTLKWHLEFNPHNSTRFKLPHLKEHDHAVIGNFQGDIADEILIASPHVSMPQPFYNFNIYNGAGTLLKPFIAPLCFFEKVAAGDVTGDGLDEIIVGDLSDGLIIYNYNGPPSMFEIKADLPLYHGLAAADMDNDGKAEIFVASPDDDTIYVYKTTEIPIKEIILPWDFEGIGPPGPDMDPPQDSFMVGNVTGDATPEIVIVDHKPGSLQPYPSDCGIIRVFDIKTELYVPGYKLAKDGSGNPFCQVNSYDAACLGDVSGDNKLELLVAFSDRTHSYGGFRILAYDLQSGIICGEYFWPTFNIYDRFVSGNVMNQYKDQILVISQQDGFVNIGMR